MNNEEESLKKKKKRYYHSSIVNQAFLKQILLIYPPVVALCSVARSFSGVVEGRISIIFYYNLYNAYIFLYQGREF